MTDIVAQMKAEEADLVRKLEAVRQFLAAYGEKPAPTPTARAAPANKPARNLTDRMDKFGSYGKGVIEAAAKMLPEDGGEPMPTRELVDRLEFIGVEIRGQNKVNALSALLARSTQIKGYGRAGWTLAGKRNSGGDDAPNENEAPNGNAAGASETRGWGAVASALSAPINPQTRPVA